jgi:hypothetical protein
MTQQEARPSAPYVCSLHWLESVTIRSDQPSVDQETVSESVEDSDDAYVRRTGVQEVAFTDSLSA